MHDDKKSKMQLLNELKDLREKLQLAQQDCLQKDKKLMENQLLLDNISTDINKRKALDLRLRQKHKMESVGILAGGIAHDFNNILGTILANTEVLCDHLQNDVNMLGYLDNITQCSLRGADLIKQILAFSRMSPLAFENVNLSQEVKKSLKMIRSGLTSEVIIELDLLAQCPPILADKIQLNQILINLCSNAQHALDGGKGAIVVAVKNAPHEHRNQLMLMVKDSGKGMSKNEIEHAFEPFYTTKEVGVGTGLGLSVVHGIVESHGATIKVDSSPGKGTCVCIFFDVMTH